MRIYVGSSLGQPHRAALRPDRGGVDRELLVFRRGTAELAASLTLQKERSTRLRISCSKVLNFKECEGWRCIADSAGSLMKGLQKQTFCITVSSTFVSLTFFSTTLPEDT